MVRQLTIGLLMMFVLHSKEVIYNMRVKAKLTRVDYTDRGKPIVKFSMDQCYLALEKPDGTFTVCDNRCNPIKFTEYEFYQLFKVIEDPSASLTNAEVELVMNALSGNPVVTSSKFADKIESILRQHVTK